jgi:hypothetical protein
VAFLVGEPDDFIFDRWAIPRPAALDSAAVERRSIERAADDLVRALVGVRDVTRELGLGDGVRRERKRDRRVISVLNVQNAVVDRALVASCSLSPVAAKSPARPATMLRSPMWMRPLRKVPVVRITVFPAITSPICVCTPLTWASLISRRSTLPW